MLLSPMMRTTRIGSLPVSLRHFLLPTLPSRAFHVSAGRPNARMTDLLQAASTEAELREAVQVVSEWMSTGQAQERWDTAPEMLDIITDKAPGLNATSFLLDIMSDLPTYDFPTVPPSRALFRKFVRAVVHQPSVPYAKPPPAAPVPRSDLNTVRRLYPRLFESDPLRMLYLLEGYHALGKPENVAWRFYHENLALRVSSNWSALDDFEVPTKSSGMGSSDARLYQTSGSAGRSSLDPELEALLFDPQEAREAIRALDALRGAYIGHETFLRQWERLDLRRAGVKFHRDRLYNLIHDNIHLVPQPATSTKPARGSWPPQRITLNTRPTPANPPPSPTRAHLKIHQPPPPLTQHSLNAFLSLPHAYHPFDPLILLFELHLRSIAPGGANSGEWVRALGRAEKGALEWERRMLREGSGGGGGSGGSWIDKEDRERMRQSLGLLKGALGERRRFWDGLDPVWLQEEEEGDGAGKGGE